MDQVVTYLLLCRKNRISEQNSTENSILAVECTGLYINVAFLFNQSLVSKILYTYSAQHTYCVSCDLASLWHLAVAQFLSP